MATKASKAPGENPYTAINTGVREDALALPEGYIALTRTEADMAALAGYEWSVAPVACVRRAGETSLGCWGSLKRVPAKVAFTDKAAVWELGAHPIEEWVPLFPDGVVSHRVAWAAQSEEVTEGVCLFVGLKQSKGTNVVDCKAFSRTTRLTMKVIAFKCKSALARPTWATVASMTASPCRVLAAGELAFPCAHAVSIA